MANIAVIVGSLRRDSINLKIAKALIKLAQQENSAHQFHLVSIADLPLYNEDLWDNIPSAVSEFKDQVKHSDVVLIVSPEYNRTISSPLKNALDWGSRPPNDNSWGHKPVAIMGASTGQIGTAVAQSHLRSVLPILNMRVMGQPEIYLKYEEGMIDEQYHIPAERTRQFLLKFLKHFDEWLKA
ncbi:NADPH-dependent FMN reductase [Alkanindiges sp. WGS2144]|uniref:NADPH-dependent FMN reductase n=1 Tax=Alkanindiges sp. WGS2144 TaxID=3366808 RepID=UPI00375051E6